MGRNELFDKLNISPYFIVENTFECVDSDSNEIINIPNYTVYNAVGQNIECIKFADENGIIKNLSESFNRFLIISLDVLICRYSPLFRAFPALFISEEPHKSFYYPLCFRSQK